MRKTLSEILAFLFIVFVVIAMLAELRTDAACTARGGVMVPGRWVDSCVRLERVP